MLISAPPTTDWEKESTCGASARDKWTCAPEDEHSSLHFTTTIHGLSWVAAAARGLHFISDSQLQAGPVLLRWLIQCKAGSLLFPLINSIFQLSLIVREYLLVRGSRTYATHISNDLPSRHTCLCDAFNYCSLCNWTSSAVSRFARKLNQRPLVLLLLCQWNKCECLECHSSAMTGI